MFVRLFILCVCSLIRLSVRVCLSFHLRAFFRASVRTCSSADILISYVLAAMIRHNRPIKLLGHIKLIQHICKAHQPGFPYPPYNSKDQGQSRNQLPTQELVSITDFERNIQKCRIQVLGLFFEAPGAPGPPSYSKAQGQSTIQLMQKLANIDKLEGNIQKFKFQPLGLFLEPQAPYSGVPYAPLKLKAWGHTRIQLPSQKLVKIRNFEGNIKKIRILGPEAVICSPQGPYFGVPKTPLIFLGTGLVYNSTSYAKSS